jgi:hypothetical protein
MSEGVRTSPLLPTITVTRVPIFKSPLRLSIFPPLHSRNPEAFYVSTFPRHSLLFYFFFSYILPLPTFIKGIPNNGPTHNSKNILKFLPLNLLLFSWSTSFLPHCLESATEYTVTLLWLTPIELFSIYQVSSFSQHSHTDSSRVSRIARVIHPQGLLLVPLAFYFLSPPSNDSVTAAAERS